MFQHSFTAEFAIINTAVLIKLMETLVAKGVLSSGDVRAIFSSAAGEIAPFQTAATQRAVALIDEQLLPKFAKSGSE